ncbi:GPI-anchor transamidase subunit GAB1 SCDLUD_000022 [Saccharomycodes ludwigii]|uniref:GPI-anchor transamidase subunit GAB1 n=1 Tax=Saccharomycodes ludwigii TaxID=36035 RepID=UPI001E8956A6|nr:hypothetical protein SCDLUD_000022 [Saccharomycodes ludwigii]KAH3902445.1 hypothetical protein SCDLUD_000022 [Saccharomycodes ludwigii]
MTKFIELKLFIICFLTRFITFTIFPNLSDVLDNSVEFSTPITSFKSLKEGIYLLNHDLPLYDGGLVHQPILLISLFRSIITSSYTLSNLLYSFVDSLFPIVLFRLMNKISTSSSGTHTKEEKIEPYNKFSWIIGSLYIINPLTFLSCISKNTCIFSNLLILLSLYIAYTYQGNRAKNMFLSGSLLALSGYLSLYSILLIIPLLSINIGLAKNRNQNDSGIFLIVGFISTLLTTIILSFTLNNFSWDFIYSVYGVNMNFEKLYPNIGLWWYFFVEMFEFFIPFFKTVFNLFLASFILPFTLRFHHTSSKNINLLLYSFVLCLSWITLTKPYPTLGDTGFVLSFLPLFFPIFCYMKYSIISILLFIHSIVLAPIFYYLWIGLGSGNSNFFYAITLVYGLALSSVIIDICWAMLRMEYDNDNGCDRPNLNIQLTQI